MEIGHILVATDLMIATRQVYRHAVGIAQAYGAKITLFHVNEPLSYGLVQTTEYLEYLELLSERIARRLHAESEYLAEQGVEVELAESVGSPAREILSYVDRHQVDLLVLARHEDSYRLLGSNLKRVVRHIEIPVLIINVEPEAEPSEFDGYDQILATTDFSEDSHRGVAEASAFANRMGADLTIVHILKLPSAIAALPGEPLLQLPRSSVDETVAELQEELEEAMEAAGLHKSQIDTFVTINEDPARGVLKSGDELNADLIVIPTHGKGAVRALIFGSTSERVLRLSTRPVLVLPRAFLEVDED